MNFANQLSSPLSFPNFGLSAVSRRLSFPLSPLQSALPKNSPVTRLESALPNSLDLKSFIIRTYEKTPGGRGKLLTSYPMRIAGPRSNATRDLSCGSTKDGCPKRAFCVPDATAGRPSGARVLTPWHSQSWLCSSPSHQSRVTSHAFRGKIYPSSPRSHSCLTPPNLP